MSKYGQQYNEQFTQKEMFEMGRKYEREQMAKHSEVEGLVEATEAALQNLSFWNVLDTDEQCELRTTLTTHGAKERERGREERTRETPPILSVGYHKGEMDFGVNCAIDELDIKQMHDFRVMTCVAIGQAENMWRRAREAHNPSAINNATQTDVTKN